MGQILSHTLSGIKWTAIERISLQGLQFGIGIILARLLTPSDYGLIAMIGIFLSIASTFIDSGMGNALIREKRASQLDYSTVFYFNIGTSTLAYLLLFFTAPLIANFFHEPILKNIVRVVALNLFIGSFGAVQRARLTRNLDFKTQAKISIITSLATGALGIILAYSGYGVWALVWQSLSSTLISNILLWMVTKWHPSLIFAKESFNRLFGYGYKLLFASLLHTLYNNLTTLLIGKFYSPKDLGYYSRGESIPSLVASNVSGILGRVTFPILAKLQDDDNLLISIYRRYIKCTSMVIIFLLLLLAALSKPIILFLLTDKWAPAIPFMVIFCLSYSTDNVAILNLNLLQVKGRSDLSLRLEAIKKTLSILMLLCAVPFGVLAICIVRLIYAQISLIPNTYYTGKLYKLGYLEQWRDFGSYYIYSAIAVTPAFLLTYTTLPNIIICIMGAIIAIPLYLAILHIRKDSAYIEFIKGGVGAYLKEKWIRNRQVN